LARTARGYKIKEMALAITSASSNLDAWRAFLTSPAPVSPTAAQNLVAAPAFESSPYRFAQSGLNLSEAAKPVYQALQSAAAFPPSANPSYVLPVQTGNFLRLFSTVQAIAAERLYPAPVFSFLA